MQNFPEITRNVEQRNAKSQNIEMPSQIRIQDEDLICVSNKNSPLCPGLA